MSKAIPCGLLPHVVLLKVKTGCDRDRNPTYDQVVLGHVRVVAAIGTTNSERGAVTADTLTLFIDCVNSTAYTTTGEYLTLTIPKVGDTVRWNGGEYTVRTVTPCFAKNGDAHHYEVALV